VSMDAAARERGRALFEGSARCADCHRGTQLTRAGLFDVGTGGSFEVPALVGVAARAPYLHDGCGKTLATMFGCGTRHGSVDGLGEAQRADLIAYVESL
jgi:cytochrome c peroxidase